MEFWSDFKKTCNAAADKTAEVAGNLTETAKIKYQVAYLKTKVKLSCRKIGELVYDSHTNGNEHASEIESECTNIDGLTEAIRAYNEQLLKLKNNKICPNCNEICDKSVLFCPNCGTKFQDRGDESEQKKTSSDGARQNAEDALSQL